MKLYTLFGNCLNTSYQQTGISANYASRKDNETLYIFFEKSNGMNDWLENLDFPIKPYKRMGRTVWFAHRGFLRVWKEIEPMLSGEIADKSIKKIVITGYSHGAAIAVLCHEYVWFNRPELRADIEGYGFGCPRVLWGRKNEGIIKRWERFTVVRNIDDIVTHLPPFLLGYFHVGKMLEIGEKGTYTAIEAHRPQNILNELAKFEKDHHRITCDKITSHRW